MKVHHIGYLVKSIEKSLESFEALGYMITVCPTWDEGRRSSICFITNGGYEVELIEPASDSELRPLLKRYRNEPYHICYLCDNLEETIAELRSSKFMLFKEPAPAPVISKSARVAFLMGSSAGMIELLER